MPSAGPFSCTNTPPELVATRWPVDGANALRMPVSRTAAATRNAAMTATTNSSRTSRVLVTQRRILAITKPHKMAWYSDRTGNRFDGTSIRRFSLPNVDVRGENIRHDRAGVVACANDAFRKSMEARLLLSAGSAPTDFAGTDEYRKQIRYSCL